MNYRYWRYRNYLEWLDFMKVHYNILREHEDGYWINYNKVLVASWGTAEFHENPKTPLNVCEVCGKTSTPKKVSQRHDVYLWDKDISFTKSGRMDYKKCARGIWDNSKTMLCMSCWNKAKAIEKRRDDGNTIADLNMKLQRSIRECQKLNRQGS